MRKSAVALALRMPGPRRALPFIEDVTVHPSEVPGYVDFLQKLFDREGVDAVMYGHVGDGNIHTRPLLDPKDAGDLRTMQRLYDEVSAYVRGIRGTMSGEHGDGLLRTPYLREMYGDTVYSLFVLVKNAFDPGGLMNPGKKVGPQEESGSLASGSALRLRLSHAAPEAHPPFPRGRVRERDREVPRLRPMQEHGRDHDVPHLQGDPARAGLPAGEGQPAAGIITGALDPDATYGQAATKAVTDYCIECGMCAVECPSNVNIPKLMLEAKSRYRAGAPRLARGPDPRPRGGDVGGSAAGSRRWPTGC